MSFDDRPEVGAAADADLERDIGLVGAVFIGVGAMIAGGIFVLSGLAAVDVALTQSRRAEPNRPRKFRVPGVPWVPALAVASNPSCRSTSSTRA